ncbi:hypothetical protein AUO95_06275 [Corynebacterium glutamicum]|nr:hypothetical protein AUO95_06275 [Corynebacterium glutamicum]
MIKANNWEAVTANPSFGRVRETQIVHGSLDKNQRLIVLADPAPAQHPLVPPPDPPLVVSLEGSLPSQE